MMCGARLGLSYGHPRRSLYARSMGPPALSAAACSCPGAGDGRVHDEGACIRCCISCRRVIDSRERRVRDEEGCHLCMRRGASKALEPAAACPCRGNTDLRTLSYFTGSLRNELSRLADPPSSRDVLVLCKARGCGYDAREFSSELE